MRRIIRIATGAAVFAVVVSLFVWLLWGWWPIGYTPFVRVGGDG